MSDSNKSDPFNVEYWKKRWDENKIGFHRSEVNPALLDNIQLVTGEKLTSEPVTDTEMFKKNSQKTWFIPLCGKMLDIPYLLSQGFKVFGVEAAKLAIEALEAEQSLGLVYDDKTNLYTGADGRLKIYLGDLFLCPTETFPLIDFVWDRGSFVAVEYPFRSAYIEVMQRALRKSGQKFKYLMDTVVYDKAKFPGPPRSVTDEDFEEFYGSWTTYKLLSEEALPEDHRVRKVVGGDTFERIYFLEPKL